MYLSIVVGDIERGGLAVDWLDSEEMRALAEYGIRGIIDGSFLSLSFENYIPASDPGEVAKAVCRFLGQYVSLSELEDPMIGVMVNKVRETFDCFPLLVAFNTFAQDKEVVPKYLGRTRLSEEMYYCQLIVEYKYLVEFSIAESVAQGGDGILLLELDLAYSPEIVEERVLAIFEELLILVLASWDTFSRLTPPERLVRKLQISWLFRKYQINLSV